MPGASGALKPRALRVEPSSLRRHDVRGFGLLGRRHRHGVDMRGHIAKHRPRVLSSFVGGEQHQCSRAAVAGGPAIQCQVVIKDQFACVVQSS